jgi:hypothetical protein
MIQLDPAEIARRERMEREREAERLREAARLQALQESAAKAAAKQAKRQTRIAMRQEQQRQRQRQRAIKRGEMELRDDAPPPPPATWVAIELEETDALSPLLEFETEEVTIACDDLIPLEPKALLGRLSDEELTCLERSLRHASRQVDRDKVSRVLVADAYAKGKLHRWEAAMRRHLTDIDRSDADLCYIFARHLAQQGPDRAPETIRWAELALQNAEQWKGALHVERTYALLKLRAVAAQKRWYQAERQFLEDPTSSRQQLAASWRNRTKTVAREWLDYARHPDIGMDPSLAFQICFSAAGTKDFCEAPGS